MDLNVWDKCNNRCLMCTNPDWPWPAWDNSYDYGYKAIIKRIDKAKEQIQSDDSIYLTGGEPTLHPYFLDIFAYISQNFPNQRIKLLTNGRRFFYKDFTKKFLDLNNDFDIDLSIHGANSHIHDAITRTPGSFEQAMGGLENLLFYRDKQMIGIRYVITKLSYQSINQFLEIIKKKFLSIDRIILIFWEIENQAIKNLESVKINHSQVRPYLEKIQPLIKDFKEIRFYHFPLCAIPEKFWPQVWRTLSKKDVDFVESCNRCLYKKYCLGIQKNYLKYIDNKEFVPIRRRLEIIETGDTFRPISEVRQRK